ncbi:MAG TPA: hypothetical protein VGM03_05910, partial [Phycisphaerae bacterium]
GGALAWWLWPQSRSFYTDADTIREPAASAATRDVLWQPPRALPEIINSSGENYEPKLSADGLMLYFVRGKAGHNADIYSAQRTPDGWSEPQPLEEINSEYDDLGPEPSAEGESLYFYSDRPGGSGGFDLWVASAAADGSQAWQAPTNLGPLVNSGFNDYGPALTPDGRTLYFASNRPRPDDARQPNPDAWPATLREDLYRRDYDLYSAAITERGIGRAEPLSALNTSYNEGAPAVSPIGDFLYFASDRPGGAGGFDLYRSRRLRGQLLPPANLGAAVNTPANEMDPALALGGFGLYFSSDRALALARPDAPRDYHLYQTSSREVFAELETLQRSIDWAAFWSRIWPSLLWALLTLLLLLLLLRIMREARYRKLSLLVKCLLASVFAHLLLLFLFNFWQVTASVAGLLKRSGGIQVALVSTETGDQIAAQMRSSVELANAAIDAQLPAPQRAASTFEPQVTADITSLEVARAAPAPEPITTSAARDAEIAPLVPPVGQATPVARAAMTAFKLPSDSAVINSSESPARDQMPSQIVTAARAAPVSAELVPRMDEFVLPPEPARTSASDAREMSLAENVRAESAPETQWPIRLTAIVPSHPPPASDLKLPPPVGQRGSQQEESRGAALPPIVDVILPRAAIAAASSNVAAPPAADIRPAAANLEALAHALPGFRQEQIRPAEPAYSPPPTKVAAPAPLPLNMALPSDASPSGPSSQTAVAETEPVSHVAAAPLANESRARPKLPLVASVTGPMSELRPEPMAAATATTESLLDPNRAAKDAAAPPGMAGRPVPQLRPTMGAEPSALNLRLPTELEALVNQYVQRAPLQRQTMLERLGGGDDTERAVALALQWLAAHQSADGHWDGRRFDARCGACGGAAGVDADAAMTGLALLCFMGADHTHAKEGPYRDHVARGVAWLLARQKPDGDLRGEETMYSQGIATIALSEAFGMTGDAKLAEPVRRAVQFIVEGRNTQTGGWR